MESIGTFNPLGSSVASGGVAGGGPSGGGLGLYISLPAGLRASFEASFQSSPAFMKAMYENETLKEKFMPNFYMVDAYLGRDGSGKYSWHMGSFFAMDPRKQDITAIHGIASPKNEAMSFNGMAYRSYLYAKAAGVDANVTGWIWDGKNSPLAYHFALMNANDTALALANYETAGYYGDMMQKALLFGPPQAEARNFMGHSMGSRQILGATEKILAQRGIPVGAVMLMDPAVDYNVFLKGGEFREAAEWAEKMVVFHSNLDQVTWLPYEIAQIGELAAVLIPPLWRIAPIEPALGEVGLIGYEPGTDYPSSVDPKNVAKGQSEIPEAWIEDHGDYFRKPWEQVGGIWKYSARQFREVRGYRGLRYGDEN